MWACRRSCLSRPRTVLNSIRRCVTVTESPVVVLAAASRWLVSDTSDSDLHLPDDAKDKAAITTCASCNGGGEEPKTPGTSRKPPAPADRRKGRRRAASSLTDTEEKKHLYLVLDDSKYGFGVHKLDIGNTAAAAADDPDVDVADDSVKFEALPSLPKPPVMRIEHSWVGKFAVLGSNVVGMSSGVRDVDDSRSDGDTLTFDTKTAKLALLPDLPNGLRKGCVRLAVAVGNMRLYVIENDTQYHGADYDHELCWGGLHCLKLEDDGDDGKKPTRPSRPADDESWWWHNTIHDRSGTQKRWFWSCDPRSLPLSPDGITAHAAHPSGRAFFVSVHCYHVDDHRGRGTFSYDTERGRWRRHGDWELPFAGKAHYHRRLRAWVGLHKHGTTSAYEGFKPDGHIYACKVPRLNGVTAPEWKVGKERLFCFEDPQRHVEAKLVDMGSGGRFCLVEIVTGPGLVDRKGRRIGDEGEKCVLRLTTFGVEYDEDGELVTVDRRPAGMFKLSKYHDFSRIFSDYWQAFWV